MSLSTFIRVLFLALLLLPGLSATAAAQDGFPSRPACDPTYASCIPDAAPAKCESTGCFSTLEAQAKFEKDNNCTFPASACGDFNADTQCCGKDPRTGKPKVVDKVMTTKDVITKGADSFTWTNYLMTCPNKKQNNAPPNELWQKCAVGKKHSPDDDYKIEEVRQNGTARDYCIEGCSTPPAAVAGAHSLGIFLFPNRNNPAGYETSPSAERTAASSFYKPCVAHDICYQTCKDDQKTCDIRLRDESIAACRTIPAAHESEVLKNIGGILTPVPINTRDQCEIAAKEMFFVLSGLKFGESAFNLRRQQYCQCC